MNYPDEIQSIADIQELAISGFEDWSRYGYVTVKKHGDLLIFNYNTMAQYEGQWNFFELVSRGLIIHAKTGEIVARPFDKFFNWFEGGRKAKGHIVTVTEKVDGSIGILFRVGDGYRIATRGSFTSTQAEWATGYLNRIYDLTGLPDELTLLFEIIYPDNRIVVDYGNREDLVLLGARNRFTGDYLPLFPDVYELSTRFGFTLPKVYTFNDVTQILERTGEINADEEGYVVEFSDGSRFKFKGDRYLELHRLISSLTFKNVLKAMQAGTLGYFLENVPDEFLGQVKQWRLEIETVVATTKLEVKTAFDIAPKETRKEFALWVNEHHPSLSKYLFASLDDKNIESIIYQHHDWRHNDDDAELE